ncbi:MAG TPA: glycine--tRNA ligase subunit beta [Rudaea sp.]|nr:glycine--tRNA ligase subunit beta [Rudaea sp.]
MSELKSLLIEIGCEELPPKALDELAAAFAQGICAGLGKRGIAADAFGAKTFCSPRRLAVLVPGVATMQPLQKSEVLGPYLNIGLGADGKPTPALLGFAAKNGVTAEQLQRTTDAKGERFVARSEKPGQPTAALMQEIVVEALKSLPIPKPMRWGDHDFAFVRPMHWLVILHGDQVIDAEIFGIKSGRDSRGHRFHHPQVVPIADAGAYVDVLRNAKVLVDSDERRARIETEIDNTGEQIGATPLLQPWLHDEIANLTEWPVVIACTFERDYLRIPHEALIQTMETNQKFVPVFTNSASDPKPKLTEHFIGVANIESEDPTEIRKGYERVIRPRFADAKFFYDEDLKAPLAAHQEALKTVTYQQQLGSVWDKCVRVAELSRVIASRLTDSGSNVDAALATRAAELSKCDLMTRMVGEFPELQGVMGRYYATAGGENAAVAQALDEFYRPRFAGDAIAQGKIAQVLAIAERLDTLAGIFAVGGKPTGSKDPFALRRAGLGLARTLIEGGFELDLEALLREAVELLPAIAPAKDAKPNAKSPPADSKRSLTDALLDFVFERLRGYYAEQGFGADQFDAVRAVDPETLADFDRRLRAVAEFAKLPEAAALAAANKRIGNILKQAADDAGGRIDPALLDAGAERELHEHIERAVATIAPLAQANRYVDMLRTLAALRAPVDAFFDQVMVMAEDAAKRRNRVALLAGLRRLFLQVADISLLQGA